MTESYPLLSGRDCVANAVDWKDFVAELKRQWRLLWRERIDDKVRAEGIASNDFELLFVDRGTVVVATRDYKQLEFKEILGQYDVPYEVKVKQPPHQSQGGWRKFAKREILSKRRGRERPLIIEKSKKGQQRKKGGRGWLHFRM